MQIAGALPAGSAPLVRLAIDLAGHGGGRAGQEASA